MPRVRAHGCSDQSPTTTEGCVLALRFHPSGLWCKTLTIFGVLSENLLRDLRFLHLDYLEFLYSGKGNVSRIFEVCKAFHRPKKQDKSLTAHFMEFFFFYI